MFTAVEYPVKAAEYGGYLSEAQSAAESVQYRELQQSFLSLADNLDWLTANAGKTISSDPLNPPRRKRRDRDALNPEQENILRCLGAAVIQNWNTIPTKLQRGLFEAASSIEGSGPTAPLKEVLAQFLHTTKTMRRSSRTAREAFRPLARIVD